MSRTPRDALCTRLATHDLLVEVGIGRRPGLARALVEAGVSVTATDRVPRETPAGVTFVQDDITNPELSVYADTEVIYARNLPPELHRPALAVARACDAAFCFTTLGGDSPAIPSTPETLPGTTLHRAHVEGLPSSTSPRHGGTRFGERGARTVPGPSAARRREE